MTIPVAGNEVDARCTKCKDVTLHAVVAMVGSEIAKVRCARCGSEHKYHPPRVAKSKTKTKTPSAPKITAKQKKTIKRLEAEALEWTEKVSNLDWEEAKPYSIKGCFELNDLINHKKFGVGLITSFIQGTKIEVLFESGVRILKCAPNFK